MGRGAFKSGIALDLGTLLRALLHGFYSQDHLQAQGILIQMRSKEYRHSVQQSICKADCMWNAKADTGTKYRSWWREVCWSCKKIKVGNQDCLCSPRWLCQEWMVVAKLLWLTWTPIGAAVMPYMNIMYISSLGFMAPVSCRKSFRTVSRRRSLAQIDRNADKPTMKTRYHCSQRYISLSSSGSV